MPIEVDALGAYDSDTGEAIDLSALTGSPTPSSGTGSGTSGTASSGSGLDSFLRTLQSAAGSGVSTYNTLNNRATTNAAARTTAAQKATLTKYLPWAIGAAALLLVLA